MSKNPDLAQVKCLECGRPAPLRRNANGRFYTYCRNGLGHEHRYDAGIGFKEDVPGYLTPANDNIPSNTNSSSERIEGPPPDVKNPESKSKSKGTGDAERGGLTKWLGWEDDE